MVHEPGGLRIQARRLGGVRGVRMNRPHPGEGPGEQ